MGKVPLPGPCFTEEKTEAPFSVRLNDRPEVTAGPGFEPAGLC